jgi:hypothetical protein
MECRRKAARRCSAQGDAVQFQEALETVEDSAALVRLVDASTLALGAKNPGP